MSSCFHKYTHCCTCLTAYAEICDWLVLCCTPRLPLLSLALDAVGGLISTPQSPRLLCSVSPQRLAQGEWFTSRVSACGLFAVAYPRANPSQHPELRQMFAQLCHDETPMVRRAAAQKLGPFAGVVEREVVSRDLLPLFTDLTSDGECLCCACIVFGPIIFR